MATSPALDGERPLTHPATDDGGGFRHSAIWPLLLTAIWAVLMGRFGEGLVYTVMGPYALLTCIAVVMLERGQLRSALRPHPRGLLLGFSVGVVMTALTYPAFALARSWFPSLEGHVEELYAQSRQAAPVLVAASVPLIIVAEELVFRQLSLRLGKRPLTAAAASVLLYASAQLGSGSFIVGGLALGCGIIWTAMRLRTDSLLPPLIAHAIWTPTVIFIVPLA